MRPILSLLVASFLVHLASSNGNFVLQLFMPKHYEYKYVIISGCIFDTSVITLPSGTKLELVPTTKLMTGVSNAQRKMAVDLISTWTTTSFGSKDQAHDNIVSNSMHGESIYKRP